jgi:ABC-type antimicrobial peptide transport system permease subunit
MPYLLGMTFAYRYPTGAAVFAFAAAVVLACAAGYFPGRSASRINIMRALQYE